LIDGPLDVPVAANTWTRARHPLVVRDHVREAVRTSTGLEPSGLNQLPAKPPRVVSEAFFDASPAVIFKAEVGMRGHDHEIALESWALRQGNQSGLLVPRVIAEDSSERSFPFRYLVMSRIDGVALEDGALAPEDRRRVLGEAASQIAALHTVAVPGYGPLNEDLYLRTGEVRGKWTDWIGATVTAGLETLAALLHAGILTAEKQQSLGRVLKDARVPEHPEAVLLHGDFDSSQLLVRDGRLAGIIDFGDRESGPPEWEFSTVWLWDESLLDGLAEAYEQASSRRLDRRLIRVYALAKLLQIVRRRLDRDEPQDAARKASEMSRFLG
jgi:aminoglycoside phosphotransferase (APT) family kinase protein